ARTVRDWIDRYEEDGLEGLRTAPRSGRPPKADESYRKLLEEVVETPPRQMGYPFNCWTLERLARHMERETGVSLHYRYLSEVLDGLGFVYKRPRHDLTHKRDQKLYRKKKRQLEELKKGL
ncbi:MAG: IS630 family transposase, partial [Armatimonadetes bacterium]|nr:IS630 family transposase [Armatimonadota bacterium]NIO96626.1 IS630 family transposase [Armatimonadota bacterium]